MLLGAPLDVGAGSERLREFLRHLPQLFVLVGSISERDTVPASPRLTISVLKEAYRARGSKVLLVVLASRL